MAAEVLPLFGDFPPLSAASACNPPRRRLFTPKAAQDEAAAPATSASSATQSSPNHPADSCQVSPAVEPSFALPTLASHAASPSATGAWARVVRRSLGLGEGGTEGAGSTGSTGSREEGCSRPAEVARSGTSPTSCCADVSMGLTGGASPADEVALPGGSGAGAVPAGSSGPADEAAALGEGEDNDSQEQSALVNAVTVDAAREGDSPPHSPKGDLPSCCVEAEMEQGGGDDSLAKSELECHVAPEEEDFAPGEACPSSEEVPLDCSYSSEDTAPPEDPVQPWDVAVEGEEEEEDSAGEKAQEAGADLKGPWGPRQLRSSGSFESPMTPFESQAWREAMCRQGCKAVIRDRPWRTIPGRRALEGSSGSRDKSPGESQVSWSGSLTWRDASRMQTAGSPQFNRDPRYSHGRKYGHRHSWGGPHMGQWSNNNMGRGPHHATSSPSWHGDEAHRLRHVTAWVHGQQYGDASWHGGWSAGAWGPPLHSAEEPIQLIRIALQKQVEYYFSVENLCKDLFLRSHMDSQGFVPISTIVAFNRMQMFRVDTAFILDSLSMSQVLEIQGESIRRRHDWKKWLPCPGSPHGGSFQETPSSPRGDSGEPGSWASSSEDAPSFVQVLTGGSSKSPSESDGGVCD